MQLSVEWNTKRYKSDNLTKAKTCALGRQSKLPASWAVSETATRNTRWGCGNRRHQVRKEKSQVPQDNVTLWNEGFAPAETKAPRLHVQRATGRLCSALDAASTKPTTGQKANAQPSEHNVTTVISRSNYCKKLNHWHTVCRRNTHVTYEYCRPLAKIPPLETTVQTRTTRPVTKTCSA